MIHFNKIIPPFETFFTRMSFVKQHIRNNSKFRRLQFHLLFFLFRLYLIRIGIGIGIGTEIGIEGSDIGMWMKQIIVFFCFFTSTLVSKNQINPMMQFVRYKITFERLTMSFQKITWRFGPRWQYHILHSLPILSHT